MLPIPIGMQDLLVSREVRVRYLLAGTDAAIAIFNGQLSAVVFEVKAHEHKPIVCATRCCLLTHAS